MIYILIFCILFQSVLHFFVFIRLWFHKSIKTSTDTELQPLSVVIAARNEAPNLRKNLPLILDQTYPNFEVLVVNDRSSDDTVDVLSQLALRYNHLKVVSIQQTESDQSSKKGAIRAGINESKNEVLVFTDADCVPSGMYWLRRMGSHFNSGSDAVIGVAPFHKKSGWLNAFQRYENVYTALMYLSFAILKRPYMAVGRNMAFNKEVFNKNVKQVKGKHLRSGDDDLFINVLDNKHKVSIETSHDSFMYSNAPENWRKWMNQKTRHHTTGFYYKWLDKIVLAINSVSKVIIWAGLIYFIFHFLVGRTSLTTVDGTIILFILLAFGLILNSIKWNVLKKLKLDMTFHELLFFTPLYIFIQPYWFIRSIFFSKTRW